MGLEVALCLLSEGWLVYIVDLNAAAGASVVEKHPGLNFIQVNVTSWSELSAAFDEAYKAQGRLDFVFANAGIAQMDDFFAREETLPPVEPPQHSIDINLKAVINTCHLARHYFQASEKLPDTDFVLIATASIGSFVSQGYQT
jgi:NAD(P)-dependent dehydrogenase (short-subunit alcohol dehydrogenase family)